MLSNTYYKDLITTLKDRVLPGKNLAHTLIDILCLSKESVYRRLRGEVPFTFDEIAVLACHFDISIDEIVNRRKHTDIPAEPLDEETLRWQAYMNIQVHLENLLRTIRNDQSAELTSASNTIPCVFFANYENLLKFRLSRQVSYESNTKVPNSLVEVSIPPRIIDLYSKFGGMIRKMPKVNFILDDNAFLSLVNEINYYHKVGMLSDTDVSNLRREIMCLLTDMDNTAAAGKFSASNSVSIFISHINFEAAYACLDKKGQHTCLHKVYSVGSSDPYNERPHTAQKNWIRSLKRHSTLISQSGEVERVRYFERQRNLLDMLAVCTVNQ